MEAKEFDPEEFLQAVVGKKAVNVLGYTEKQLEQLVNEKRLFKGEIHYAGSAPSDDVYGITPNIAATFNAGKV